VTLYEYDIMLVDVIFEQWEVFHAQRMANCDSETSYVDICYVDQMNNLRFIQSMH
jgi:hypothetical protein